MKEFVKKYYIYIIIIVVSVFALFLSWDFDKEPEVNLVNTISEQDVNNPYIYVDIRGSILNPGVYKVETGTRLFQLISLSGGFTDDVKENVVNQSVLLEDEMYIYIPNINDDIEQGSSNSDNVDSKLVNINTASKTELETLSGIGPSTAQSIIDYREEHGEFLSIEDLMKVPGIGEATFNDIKSDITV